MGILQEMNVVLLLRNSTVLILLSSFFCSGKCFWMLLSLDYEKSLGLYTIDLIDVHVILKISNIDLSII